LCLFALSLIQLPPRPARAPLHSPSLSSYRKERWSRARVCALSLPASISLSLCCAHACTLSPSLSLTLTLSSFDSHQQHHPPSNTFYLLQTLYTHTVISSTTRHQTRSLSLSHINTHTVISSTTRLQTRSLSLSHINTHTVVSGTTRLQTRSMCSTCLNCRPHEQTWEGRGWLHTSTIRSERCRVRGRQRALSPSL